MNNAIEVSSLRYTYAGQKQPALNGLEFEVGQGEIFGFLGPSGSGKSTTQKVLAGLLKHRLGDIRVLGQDLNRWGVDYYRRIGVGFELPNHFNKLTARENLTLFQSLYATGNGPGQRPGRGIDELLSLLTLDNDAEQLVDNYSKGMKMRLNFARAILHDPDIIFLDEPTAGLDPVNAARLKNIIRQLKAEGKTIFLTTHNMHDADELCDRVAFIVEGNLQLIGKPRELKQQFGRPQVVVEYKALGAAATDANIPSNADDYAPMQVAEFSFESLGKNAEFLDILNSGRLESIHSEEATLEQVFIKATGHQLL